MLATALTVLLSLGLVVASSLLLIKAFRVFARREKAFTKVTIPPTFYRTIDAKTIVETQPMMQGLGAQLEQAAADQAAKELASKIEFDLYRGADASNEPPPAPEATVKDGLNAMLGYYDDKRNSDDDWSTVGLPTKRKTTKKRKPAAKKKATKKRQSKR